ncbi:unnamed protein product [Rotaria sordida]|uniref:EGF-like domain-containing protein n=1 Tax=Rotaria sordida TaxID=392033 RepID=A0A813XRG8_9BILA|nr:unnamed protein product [Rotaria sordida]CAF0898939.1 unnamed protein product [Rotaria sordida]
MSRRELFVLALVLHILVVQLTASRVYSDEDDDDDDNAYRLIKPLYFRQYITPSTERTPSILDNLIRPSSTYSPNEKSTSGTQYSTSSPSYSSLDPCALNPCDHGGICIRKGQMTYECKCVGPWRGIHCGIADACYRSPCQHGGTCLNVHDDYWCQCTSDYYGTDCQKKFTGPSYSENHCRPNICHTGQCISLQTTYYCQCSNDRYGEHCEKKLFKREIFNMRLYQNLLHKLKRGMLKQGRKTQNGHDGDGVAYYDVKNGIYF